jgi:hypothetical protein
LIVPLLEPIIGIENGIGIVPKNDLMRWLLEFLATEPAVIDWPP